MTRAIGEDIDQASPTPWPANVSSSPLSYHLARPLLESWPSLWPVYVLGTDLRDITISLLTHRYGLLNQVGRMSA